MYNTIMNNVNNMNYTVINSRIDEDVLVKVSNLLSDKEIDKITIYLNTPGGVLWCGLAIMDMLHTNKDRVRLVAAGEISSIGVDILIYSGCEYEILDYCTFCIHKIRSNTNRTLDGKAVIHEFDRVDNIVEYEKKHDARMLKLLDEKEKAIYKQAKDVIIDGGEFKKRLKK